MTLRIPRHHPPRSRRREADDATLLDGSALAQQDLARLDGAVAGDAAAEAQPAAAESADDSAESAQWRDKLARLVRSGALTPMQETEFFRLFQAQEDALREAMPRLLADVEPHFGTTGEAAAKDRFVQALHALKRQQEEELTRLLASMGIESRQPGTA